MQEKRSESEIRHLVSKTGNAPLSIRKQCELLGISRSTYYHTPKGESDENLDIMRKMDEHHTEHPDEGVGGMCNMLRLDGHVVNHKRIRRLMKLMNIKAIYPQKNLTKLAKGEYVYPYLLRNYAVVRANQVWSIDISYVAMEHGFMYLTAIIDVCSRFVIGWDLGNSLEAEVSVNLLKKCIAQYGTPEIVNSDQGSQYTSNLWGDTLKKNSIQISMDGKGRATDNIWIERFWRTIKRGHIYLHPAADGAELYQGIKKYITYYNHRRGHTELGGVPPCRYFMTGDVKPIIKKRRKKKNEKIAA